MSKPDITVYFLGASRAIRIVWLLEELDLPYKLVSSERSPDGTAPPEFKAKIPAPLKKSPTIKDGDIVVQESGAILDYIVDNYDKEGKLQSSDPRIRAKTREWVHAAEVPGEYKSVKAEMEGKMSKNIHNDLDWIEGHLKEVGSKFLMGDKVSSADIMMQFSIEFIYTMKLGLNAEDAGEGGGNG